MNTQATSPATPATPRVPGRVLVTGATGLLGSNVTAALLTAGAEVLALARSRDRAVRLLPAHERLRVIEGDVTDTSTFAGHLPGLSGIIHTAAYFREYYQPGGNDPAQLQRVNVDAIGNLLRAAADAGVPVVVHTSSATTIGTPPAASPPTKTPPQTPAGSATATAPAKSALSRLSATGPKNAGSGSRSSCPPGCSDPATPPPPPPAGYSSPWPAAS